MPKGSSTWASIFILSDVLHFFWQAYDYQICLMIFFTLVEFNINLVRINVPRILRRTSSKVCCMSFMHSNVTWYINNTWRNTIPNCFSMNAVLTNPLLVSPCIPFITNPICVVFFVLVISYVPNRLFRSAYLKYCISIKMYFISMRDCTYSQFCISNMYDFMMHFKLFRLFNQWLKLKWVIGVINFRECSFKVKKYQKNQQTYLYVYIQCYQYGETHTKNHSVNVKEVAFL